MKINIPDKDRDKRSQSSLITVIGEKTARKKYRLVCKGGILARCFDRTQLSLIPDAIAELVGLEDELQKWSELPAITLRAAEKFKTLSLDMRDSMIMQRNP